MNKKLKSQAQLIWEEYQKGVEYQSKVNLGKRINLNYDFVEGRQWGKISARTASLPRPVINFTCMIVDNKCSAMNNTPVKVIFQADDNRSTEEFTRFNDFECKRMHMEELDAQAIRDCCITGNFVKHYYLDKDDQEGIQGVVEGCIQCELVDIRNLIVANPLEADIQKQKYLIIATRESVEAVREYAKANNKRIDVDSIKADDSEDTSQNSQETEQDGSEVCTVLTKYFKRDGEVWCVKTTRDVVVKPEYTLSLDLEKARKDVGLDKKEKIDEENTASPDQPQANKKTDQYKARLYPIVLGTYKPRKYSIYGLSEVEGLISVQRSVNMYIAMLLYAQQQMAWAKWVVKKDALRGQVITNESGQIIVDYSPGGDGIKALYGASQGSTGIALLDTIINYTRVVTGSTEVMTGELFSKSGMSGAAIAQLQAQAQQPIEQLRNRFWATKEKEAKVLEQFYRIYYSGKNYEYKYSQVKEDQSGETEIQSAQFNADKYAGVNFSIVAKAQTGTRSSTSSDIAFLEALLQKDALSIYEFTEAYPEEALTHKGDFLKLLERHKASDMALLQQTLQEREQQLAQALQNLETSNKALAAVQATNKENESLREDIAKLYNQVRTLRNAGSAMSEAAKGFYDDANLFAGELANRMNEPIDQADVI